MRSIATYPLAALCGLAMIVALFLPWLNLGGGIPGLSGLDTEGLSVPGIEASLGPMDMLESDGFSIEAMLQEPIGIAIAASLLLAAAVAILGFLGGSVPRIFAVLGGALPFGILGWAYLQMQDQIPALPGGLTLSDLTGGEGGISGAYEIVSPFIGMGLYAFFGGALVMLLLGLLSPGKKETY